MAQEKLEKQQSSQSGGHVNSESSSSNKQAAAAPKPAAAPASGGGGGAQGAAPVQGGSATAFAPSGGGSAGYGVTVAKGNTAPPVSAGATGNNAGNNGSASAGGGAVSLGSGGGNPLTVFMPDLAELENTNVKVAAFSFMNKATDLFFNKAQYNEGSGVATFSNINIGSVNANGISITNAKINSIAFNSKTKTLQNVSISSGAIKMSAGDLFSAGGASATLSGGAGEYTVNVSGPSVSVLGQKASANGAQLKLGSGGQFMGIQVNGAQAGEHKAGQITIGPSGASVQSLETKLPILGASRGVKFSNLGVGNGMWSGTGQLDPIGQASLMGGKIQANNINGQIGLNQNKVNGTVNAGLSLENGLAKADQVQISIADKSIQGSIAGVTASILGQNLALGGASIDFNPTGDVTSIKAAGISGNNFSLQSFEASPGSIKLNDATVTIPQVLQKAIELKVQDISAQGGAWKASATVTPSEPVSFLDNKLTIPDLKATVDVAGGSVGGSITGNIAYNDPARMITANGLGTITIGNTPDFQVANGTVKAELAGMQFAGEGVQINAAQPSLTIANGTISAPIFNGAVSTQITNGRVDNSGFNFDSLTIATGQPIEVAPNFKVGGSMTLVKNGEAYEVKLENGSLDLQGLPGGVTAASAVNMTYNPADGGFSGEIIGPKVAGNFGEIASGETISFSQSGFTIPSATATINSPTGPLNAQVTNVSYSGAALTIGTLSTQLPPIFNTQVTVDATNVAIADGGLTGQATATVSDQTIALGGGVITATNLTANANIEAGQYNVELLGTVGVANLAGFNGGGEVKVTVENGQPNVAITNGTINGTTSAVQIDGQGLSYDSATQVVGVETVNIAVPQFQGGQVSGTANGVTIGPSGFEGTVNITGANVQVVPGLEITTFNGDYTSAAGVESLSAQGSAVFVGASEMVNINNVDYKNEGGITTVDVQQVDIKTPFVQGLVDGIQYDQAAGTFKAAQATLNTQGLEALGGPIAEVNGLTISQTGVQMDSLEAGLKVGENIITLTGNGVSYPYGGAATGNLEVTASDTIQIANGVIMVNEAKGNATLTGSGVDFTLSGQILAGAPLAGMQASGGVEVKYDAASGAFSGEIVAPNFTSDVFEMKSSETATFDQTGFKLGSATTTLVTNSFDLDGTMTDISADASGLTIGKFEASSINILDTQANLTLTNISIGSGGVKVGEISTVLNPTTIGIIPGKVEASNVEAKATFANNNIDFSLEGDLAVSNLKNFYGEGRVKVTVENQEPNIEITNGQLIAESEGLNINATDIGYTSASNTLTAGNVDIKVGGFKSGEVTGNAQGVQISENGFEGEVTVTGSEVEVVTGVKITSLDGKYISQAGNETIEAKGSATVGPNQELKINSVEYQSNNGTQNVSAKDITLDTAHFSGNASDAAFDQASGTFTIATATATTKGMESLGSPQATINGLEVTESGLKVESLTSEITLASLGSGLSLQGTNLNYPYGGAPTGEAQITTTAPISIANGALTMENIIGSGKLAESGWDIELAGGLKAATAAGGLQVNATGLLKYSSTGGFTGEVDKASIDTDFVLIESTAIKFDDQTFEMQSATGVVTVAGKELADSEVKDVKFDAAGLSVAEVKTHVPDLLGAEVNVSATQLTVGGGGVNIGKVDADFTKDSIDIVEGYLQAKGLKGDGTYENNALNLKISGDLSLSGLEGASASGSVEATLENGKPNITITNGQASVTQLGATIEATGLDYDSSTQVVKIQQAELKLPEFKNGEVKGTASDMTISKTGFEGTAGLSGTNIEVAKNVTIDSLTGEYSNKGGSTSIKAEGSSTINIGSNQINIQKVGFENIDSVKKISAQGIKFSTNFFDADIANAEYEESTGTFTMAQANLVTKNMDALGNPTGQANDLKVNDKGVDVGSLKAGLTWDGVANAIQLEGNDLKFPFSGAPSGTAKVKATTPIQIAKGAFALENTEGEATLNNDGWAFKMSSGLKMNMPNANASGTVNLSYDKANGIDVKVEGGGFAMQMPALGLGVEASNINYDHTAGVLTIGSGTASLDKLAGGVSGKVSNLSISGRNFNFDRIEMSVGSGQVELVPGIKIATPTLGLSKKGSGIVVDAAGGIEVNRATPMVKASGQGKLEFDLTNKKLTGNASSVSIETSIFKTQVSNVTFSNGGFNIGQAELNIGQNMDPALFKKYIPGFEPWMLEVVSGVKFIGKNISYSEADGLKVGSFYPDIPPIPFSFMGGALKGSLDIKNQKGNVSGEKKFELPKIKTPEIKVPVAGPVPIFATVGVAVSASASIGANLSLQKQGSIWNFSGGLSAAAKASIEVRGGVSLDVGIASAGVKVALGAEIAAKGKAQLGGGLRFDPKKKSVELAGPMNFNYNMMAELAAKLKVILEGRFAIWTKEFPIDIASWKIGSVELSGSSTSNDMNGLLGNLKNNAKVIGPGGKVVYQK